MINGFFIIDKPAGLTSHDVVSRVRRILGTRKVGHTGTLDPFATGVLPVAVNDGTKVIPFLDEGIKTYEALLRFGITTDTLDMTGSVLSENSPSALTRDRLFACLKAFTGRISQIPPMYSAVKQNGQPLYKLARKGEEVERKPRQIDIHALDVLSFDLPCAALRVTCSRGTYVRSLADDIGRQLGCGAALQELRRTASGLFQIEDSLTIEALEELAAERKVEEKYLSPSAVLGHLPELLLDDAEWALVRHGRAPACDPGCFSDLGPYSSRLVRLTWDGRLAAVGQVNGEAADPRIVLKRVFV